MRRSRFTAEQIRWFLDLNQAGMSAVELGRSYGFSLSLFYGWRAKANPNAGRDVSEMTWLAVENLRLRRLIEDLNDDRERLCGELRRNGIALPVAQPGQTARVKV